MTYEVYSYKTKLDFERRTPTNIIDNFTNKSDAAFMAITETEHNAVVKLQSEDREEIWIIKEHQW